MALSPAKENNGIVTGLGIKIRLIRFERKPKQLGYSHRNMNIDIQNEVNEANDEGIQQACHILKWKLGLCK